MAEKKTAKKTAKKVKKASAKTTVSKNKPSQTVAIVALILNIIIMPGLGTLVGGRIKEGVWQLILFFVGGFLSIFLVGIPLVIAAWIWGIVSGVRLIQESQ